MSSSCDSSLRFGAARLHPLWSADYSCPRYLPIPIEVGVLPQRRKFTRRCGRSAHFLFSLEAYGALFVPQDEKHTRLITRFRIKYNWFSRSIFGMLMVVVVELAMMRKCLLGNKQRVEAAS